MSEGEPERQLEVDEEGRVKFKGTLPTIENGASVWENVINEEVLQQLKEECKSAVVKRTTGKQQYSRGSTYWLGATAEPKSKLEEYVKQVFEFHSSSAIFDKSTSGAEWWALSLDGDSQVGWHWDKDYYLESEMNINVYPQIGTVTYFTDVGCGTAALNSVAPFSTIEPITSNPTKAWCCFPKPTRHFAFDGRYLHGAVSGGKPASEQSHRVTLLINIWLNHEPITADPFFSDNHKVHNGSAVTADFKTKGCLTAASQLPGESIFTFRAGKKRKATLRMVSNEGGQPSETIEKVFEIENSENAIATITESINDNESSDEEEETEEDEEEEESSEAEEEQTIKRQKPE